MGSASPNVFKPAISGSITPHRSIPVIRQRPRMVSGRLTRTAIESRSIRREQLPYQGHTMSVCAKERFAPVSLMIVLFISFALITRIILLVSSFNQIDLGIFVLIKLFFIGALYDFVTAVYCMAPMAVYLTLMPTKLFNNRFHKYLFWLFLFILINLLTFNIFSEWFFWDEFGKRFNFIAVDYLVYTHEVINNILESYPIPVLVGLVLFISTCPFLPFIIKNRML